MTAFERKTQPDSVCCTDSAEINCHCIDVSQLGVVRERGGDGFLKKELSHLGAMQWCSIEVKER